MKVKAFIYLPETDAAFEMLHNNPDSYQEVINELFSVKKKLKEKGIYDLYFDAANISSFIQVATGLLPDPHLAGIKGQLQHILKYTSTDVNLPVFRSSQHIYANWAISVSVISSPFVVAESAESSLQDNEAEKTICICLGNSIDVNREELHIIKDAIREPALPKVLFVTATNSSVGFVRWITTIADGTFKLSGNNDFEPLEKYWRKERIYRHKQTGNHWYFDFFHRENKIHYEVFDSTGNTYLGEADINGNMIQGTNVGNKKISDII
ncbi:MAG: hypothetical protein HZA79_04520 [Sphingobacteriales bacterium]|nr:hypothetical protein [Sphingobacteriales bacterium]